MLCVEVRAAPQRNVRTATRAVLTNFFGVLLAVYCGILERKRRNIQWCRMHAAPNPTSSVYIPSWFVHTWCVALRCVALSCGAARTTATQRNATHPAWTNFCVVMQHIVVCIRGVRVDPLPAGMGRDSGTGTKSTGRLRVYPFYL